MKLKLSQFDIKVTKGTKDRLHDWTQPNNYFVTHDTWNFNRYKTLNMNICSPKFNNKHAIDFFLFPPLEVGVSFIILKLEFSCQFRNYFFLHNIHITSTYIDLICSIRNPSIFHNQLTCNYSSTWEWDNGIYPSLHL